MTQVTAADVETQGVTRIEDLVNQLPQAFAAQNVTVANGATGTATLNLRGLGSPRTLVLIDGRRMPYGGVTQLGGGHQPDPDADGRAGRHPHGRRLGRLRLGRGRRRRQLHHEEGLRGRPGHHASTTSTGTRTTSAARAQSSCATSIAGRAQTNPAQFQLPDDTVTDGEGKELSLMVGVNSGDGRGNITAYATVFDSEQVLQRDRDYSACSLIRESDGRVLCLRRLGTSAGGYVHGDFADLLPDGRHADDTFRPSIEAPTCTTSVR